MKKMFFFSLGLIFTLLVNTGYAAESLVSQGDALRLKGGIENFEAAIKIYEQAATANPSDYEANWKCARIYRDYGNWYKETQKGDWEKKCADAGKKGMAYAEKAIAANSNKPEGFYFYGVCAGIYSDGAGIMTALKEGLKDKIQSNLEKAYSIDKNYDDGSPPLALGRFWAMVPFPFTDKDKALKYYNEYLSITKHSVPHDDERNLYVAELLIDKGGDSNIAKAKPLLEKASRSSNAYYKKQASELMKEMN
jgi:tetratricopeptide (TPR) repeat protein